MPKLVFSNTKTTVNNDLVELSLRVLSDVGWTLKSTFFLDASKQGRNNELRRQKKAIMKKKCQTYLRHAEKFNNHHNPIYPLAVPSFEDMLALPITDQFWDVAALGHLDEPWANHKRTKIGIQAYLKERSCQEELRRIGREVRQMMLWAFDYQARIDTIRPNPETGQWREVKCSVVAVSFVCTDATLAFSQTPSGRATVSTCRSGYGGLSSVEKVGSRDA